MSHVLNPGYLEFTDNAAPGVDKEILNQPFWIVAAAYSAPNVLVDMGPGRADFSNPAGARLAEVARGSTSRITISSPVVSTTYYIFAGPPASDVAPPTWRYSTSATPQPGEARIGKVTTSNPITGPVTRADMRGILPVPSSALSTNAADIRNIASNSALGSSALGAPADHVHGVPGGGATVSGLSADMVDGYHIGYGWYNVPLNSDQLCQYLNADRVDSFHVGSGGISVRDGTTQTGLWAETIKGVPLAATGHALPGDLSLAICHNGSPRKFFTATSRYDPEAEEGDVLFDG